MHFPNVVVPRRLLSVERTPSGISRADYLKANKSYTRTGRVTSQGANVRLIIAKCTAEIDGFELGARLKSPWGVPMVPRLENQPKPYGQSLQLSLKSRRPSVPSPPRLRPALSLSERSCTERGNQFLHRAPIKVSFLYLTELWVARLQSLSVSRSVCRGIGTASFLFKTRQTRKSSRSVHTLFSSTTMVSLSRLSTTKDGHFISPLTGVYSNPPCGMLERATR